MASTRSTGPDNLEWKALDTFPVLVWKNIFLRLDKQSDKVNLINSSNFKCVLLNYPEFYMDLVFDHVAPYLKQCDVRNKQNESKRKQNNVRICRQVCRHWDKLFVKYLDVIYDSVDTFPAPNLPHVVNVDTLYIKCPNGFDRWKARMDPMLTNPVASRSFCLEPGYTPRGFNEFIIRSIDHLSTWGQHTWNLRINFEYFDYYQSRMPVIAEPFTIIDYLGFVQSCLRHLPNLKTLNLDYILSGENVDPQIVQDWVTIHPFPRLPFLRHFNIAPFLINVPIWEGLLTTYQSSLESLTVKSAPCCSVLQNRFFTFPRLTKLTLFLSQREISIIRATAERSSWSLKKLDMTIGLAHKLADDQKIDFQYLLQHSESTLEVLSVWMNASLRDTPGENVFVGATLSHLKLFEMKHFDVHSLDFLADFSPNLKHVTVRETLSGSRFVNRIRKRRSANILRLYKPNGLWNQLPSLISIEIYWFRNDEYEFVCHCLRNDFKFWKLRY